MITYSYKAETSLAYLNSNRKKAAVAINCLEMRPVSHRFYNSTNSAALAWSFGDLGFGVMAWLNMIALLFLTKPVLKAVKDYDVQKNKEKIQYLIR